MWLAVAPVTVLFFKKQFWLAEGLLLMFLTLMVEHDCLITIRYVNGQFNITLRAETSSNIVHGYSDLLALIFCYTAQNWLHLVCN